MQQSILEPFTQSLFPSLIPLCHNARFEYLYEKANVLLYPLPKKAVAINYAVVNTNIISNFSLDLVSRSLVFCCMIPSF